MELYEKSVCELKTMIKKREISCLELAQAHIGRIESTNGVLETFLTKTYDTARAKAKSLDARLAAGEDIGPLGGIPFALKDNMCVDGVRTTCSSKLLVNFIAPYSCHVYERLDADGAVLLGKVDMDEFAMGASNENSAYGTVKNRTTRRAFPAALRALPRQASLRDRMRSRLAATRAAAYAPRPLSAI
jgi:aspartyl-tRNA(Asn)/glutamyl-tRNA(Gln) amidotransferase subunit A